jgi:hypothetical protein
MSEETIEQLLSTLVSLAFLSFLLSFSSLVGSIAAFSRLNRLEADYCSHKVYGRIENSASGSSSLCEEEGGMSCDRMV